MLDKKKIIDLRQNLHKLPEISGSEKNTLARIKKFIKNYNPDKTYNILNDTGIAFEFFGEERGNTIVFHAPIHAQHINEETELPYRSVIPNISHKIGNDGHIAILCGLSEMLNQKKLKKGRIILLFHSKEDVFVPTENFLDDKIFKKINPDYIFGFHNLPEYELNKIILKKNNFSISTSGMQIKLIGTPTSLSAQDEGRNPINTISDIADLIQQIKPVLEKYQNYLNVTITNIVIGSKTVNTYPANAEILISIQAANNREKEEIITFIKSKIEDIVIQNKLRYKISFTEDIPEIQNNRVCLDIVEQAAKENKLETKYISEPVKFSNDFGFYTLKYKGAFFGIGAGNKTSKLHTLNYDFPNDILITGINMLNSICRLLN